MPATAIPSPFGGWNARDSFDKMEATDAVRMVNMIPRAGFVETRKGYVVHADGHGGPVETLIGYRGTAAEKMVSAANGNLWDVTNDPPVSLDSGFTNNRWQSTMHGNNLVLTNGFDDPQVYDGAVVTPLVVTGVTASTLWACNTYKGRVYYWQQNANSFWYPAAGAYQGALTEFTFDGLTQTGGALIQMVTWTMDTGDGMDDMAVFIFSTGEVLLYSGSNPADAADWALVGRFQIGEPLGPRAHAKVGGTEIILTRDGYVDLGAALKDGRYSEASTYSAKIIREAKTVANAYYLNFGWEATLYPSGQMFVVNVPLTETQSVQHVRSTSTGGWCKFEGMNALCFAVHLNQLWFGSSNGTVYHADIGPQDVDAPIMFDVIQAYNSFGTQAGQKQMTGVNVISNYAFPQYFALEALPDYSGQRRGSVIPGPYVPGAGWDTSDWDVTDWDTSSDELVSTREAWRNLSGMGFNLALSLRGGTRSQSIIWYSTKFQFRNAGAI